MSDAQLVRESWAIVCSAFTFDQVGALFYDTLFAANPTLPTTIFRGIDVKKQAIKLIQMIDGAIKLLDRPDELVPVLIALGERHAGYGTEEAHFAPVGAALIGVLAKGLGAKFDAATKQAWLNVYGVIQAKMTEGLNNAEGKRQKLVGPYAVRNPDLVKQSNEDLVRASWKLVLDSFTSEQVGLVFYRTLFDMDPTLESTLFAGVKDSAQAIQLIQMIDGAVKMLDRPIALVPVLVSLGERHAGYGVTAKHMKMGGEALIITLRKVLGNKLSKEDEKAWNAIYNVIDNTMAMGLNNARGKANMVAYLSRTRPQSVVSGQMIVAAVVGAIAAIALLSLR